MHQKLKRNVLKSYVTRFTTHTCLALRGQIRLLQIAWILSSDWIKWRGSHARHARELLTCCKTRLPWVGKTRIMYRFYCKKLELLSNHNLQTTWFLARKVWFVGGKTRNTVIKLILQYYCKTSWAVFFACFIVPLKACWIIERRSWISFN